MIYSSFFFKNLLLCLSCKSLPKLFVRSEDNDSDIFTKNLGNDLLHDKHSSKFLKKNEE